MRSIEETIIANFLFLHGVEYEYEREYPFYDEGDKRRYHPDFYLPEYDLYLEHFGINSQGRLPWLPEIEEKKYLKEMEWKRKHHKKHGTKLIESYSYWKRQGLLIENLEKLLLANGVEFRAIDDSEILGRIIIEEEKSIAQVETFKLMETLIRLLKESSETDFSRLRMKAGKVQSTYEMKRELCLLGIIETIYNEYERLLKERGAIDFADMILESTREIESGRYQTKYRYVIVDEFQDISVGRAKLIQAVRKQGESKLFCVGDDWQAIYRFAGCEVDFLTHFAKHFGYSKLLKIEHTYRNSMELVQAVGPFIMANPNQIKKSLRSDLHEQKPIRLYCYNYDSKSAVLGKAVEKIAAEHGRGTRILLLMRNRFDIQFIIDDTGNWTVENNQDGGFTVVYKRIPSLTITANTVHASKGVEEENVIIINSENSIHGFPNKMQDDPILNLVLSNPEEFEFAEERRLFYVALTRTRHCTYILVPITNASVFIHELAESNSKSLVAVYMQEDNNAGKRQPCPKCRTGRLVLRTNELTGSKFVGCSNYPQCDFTLNDVSILKGRAKRCPCGGFMRRLTGPYGDFWGCSNYPMCRKTESIEDRYTKV